MNQICVAVYIREYSPDALRHSLSYIPCLFLVAGQTLSFIVTHFSKMCFGPDTELYIALVFIIVLV